MSEGRDGGPAGGPLTLADPPRQTVANKPPGLPRWSKVHLVRSTPGGKDTWQEGHLVGRAPGGKHTWWDLHLVKHPQPTPAYPPHHLCPASS